MQPHLLLLVTSCRPGIGETLKIHQKSIFDQNQLKLSPHHKNVYAFENIIKMENSLLFNFSKLRPETMYYSTGTSHDCFIGRITHLV